jgi:CubicO group peptidase (beta-lactamase class C family)
MKESSMTVQGNTGRQVERIDEFIQTVMRDNKVPGLALAVVKDGEVLLSRGFGRRNVAEDRDVTSQTLFAIGSSSKAFTAMALAALVDEGKLDWNTPVRQYMPTFKLYDAVATEHLTPKDLLIHSSGLPRHDTAWYHSTISRKDLFDRLQYFEPTCDLRTTWQYQNMMYMAAGYLIEVITRQTWEEFVRQRFLKPLGMANTNFSVLDSQQTADFALPYREINGEVRQIAFYDRFQAVGPAGSINSSVDDMAKWLRCLLNKGKYGESEDGEQRLVSEAQFDQLITPQSVCPALPTLYTKYEETFHWTYGLGWFVSSYRGHTMVQHGGNIDGFSALVGFLPDDHIGIVVLTNLSSNFATEVVLFNVCDRLLGLSEVDWYERFQTRNTELKGQLEKTKQENEAERVPDAPLSHALSAYTGEYGHPGYGTFTIKQDGDGLKGVYNDLEFAFKHHHYDVFIISQERFDFNFKGSFSTNLKGDIASFAVKLGLEPGLKPTVFMRDADKDTA